MEQKRKWCHSTRQYSTREQEVQDETDSKQMTAEDRSSWLGRGGAERRQLVRRLI